MTRAEDGRDRMLRELAELHRLDREALEACREALGRLEGPEWQRAVSELASEHERRAEEIARRLRELGGEPTSGRRPLGRAKRRSVVAGAMGGDRGVLLTLLAAEQATTRRWAETPGELADLLRQWHAEEHAHVARLREGVARLSAGAS